MIAIFTVNLGAPRENTHLYYTYRTTNIESGRNHSTRCTQPLNQGKKIGLLAREVSCARKPLSPETAGHRESRSRFQIFWQLIQWCLSHTNLTFLFLLRH